MSERFEILKAKGLRALILQPTVNELKDLKKSLLNDLPPFHLTVGESPILFPNTDFREVTGYLSSAYISRVARAQNEIVCLSGQGADEIISDYYNPHSNSRRSFFRGDWKRATTPWPNFFGGWNRVFLEASERIVGHFGIETRYPFLDPMVIQAFLNLTPEAKGRAYKACIYDRLHRLTFQLITERLDSTGFPKIF